MAQEKRWLVILKKMKKNTENFYAVVGVTVNKYDKISISNANTWSAEMIKKVSELNESTPLNFSINAKGEIVEDNGVFKRFDEGANAVIIRRLNYPSYTSFQVLLVTQQGITLKEIKEEDIISYSNKSNTSLIQNAIIRGNVVCSYPNKQFDTVEVKEEPKVKQPKKEPKVENTTGLKFSNLFSEAEKKNLIKVAALSQLKAQDIEDAAFGIELNPVLQENKAQDNMKVVDYMRTSYIETMYDLTKIGQGTEKPFDVTSPYANEVFEKLIRNMRMVIPNFTHEKDKKTFVKNAMAYFGAISDEKMRNYALHCIQEFSKIKLEGRA